MTELPDVIVIVDDQTSSVITVEVPSDAPDVITVEVPDPTGPDIIEINTGFAGPPGKTIESASWTYMGTITPYVGLGRWVYPGDYLLRTVQLSIATPPAGADVIVDVNVNSASIFADQSQRPRILAGGTSALVVLATPVAVGVNDSITVDIDQVGSSSPGTTLVAIVRAESI